MADVLERRIVTGKVAQRREAKVATIVTAAWQIAGEVGIAGLSLRGVAREVGMRQPSLYEYFDSKHALYDEMFADGNRKLLERIEAVTFPDDPRRALKTYLNIFVGFALEDPARCELLFQRHVPGFTPSPQSYALAGRVLERLGEFTVKAGVANAGDVDCIVAVTAGILEAQLSNDPGGNRWTRHLDRLVDLMVNDALERSAR